MSKKIKSFMSIAVATAMSLMNIAGTISFNAQAALDEYSEDAMIPVIITLNGGAVLDSEAASGKGADFLESHEAEEMTGEIASVQEKVQKEIRSFYPELEIGYSYSVLVNGFSCELPESLIDDAEALPQVESVTEVKSIALPQMVQSAELGGIPSYYTSADCTGKGQVIAVIDTELDISHPMFAAMDDDTGVKLSKEDIAGIAADSNLNISIDPEKAYISNKLPYVVDYIYDPYTGYMDHTNHSYHGTHVAGIAAGNEVKDESGNTISGVAKDAQILFMAASDGLQFRIDIALAAAEDAVKLRADVINMSIGVEGDAFGSQLYSKAINAADNAGVTFCIAAGNDGDGSSKRGGAYSTDEPDRSYVNALASFSNGALCVASADTPSSTEVPVFSFDDKQIQYSNMSFADGTFAEMSQKLGTGDFDYVYCGYGLEEEIASFDLNGKIALVDRGVNSFDEKNSNAAKAGAVGVIVAMRDGEELINIQTDPNSIPSCLISYSDGQLLRNAEKKQITLTGETGMHQTPPAVSAFSSYGVPLSLELRPDITGFGGNVESAFYDGGFRYNSGTSMASPYIAGCAALLREYMDKNGIELSGQDKTRFIRNILMSSAVPFSEGSDYTSPRRQGAGLVSMENVMNDKVIITGDSGECKINLRDKLEDEFSFDVCLENISSEDVDFSEAQVVLSTDGYITDAETGASYISGQTHLSCEADLTGILHTDAGEKRTEHISIKLLPDQSAQLSEIFRNGFFVEGYILLKGAENCCDISIPLCGFHGDWCAESPIITTLPCVCSGTSGIIGGLSLAETAKIAGEVAANIPAEELNTIMLTPSALFDKYCTDEQKMKLTAPANDIYISPNGDGLADVFGLLLYNRRYSYVTSMNIFDENGKNMSPERSSLICFGMKNAAVSIINTEEEVTQLPEGRYTGIISCDIGYDQSGKSAQTLSGGFTIDKTAPVLKHSESEKDGRKILTLTASDSCLDGIIISGKGKGGIAGAYDPEADTASVSLSARMAIAEKLIDTGIQVKNDVTSGADVPLAGRCFCGNASEAELADCDFSDVIIAVPDENGIFTVDYDITDLEGVKVAVFDKAMNMTSIEAEEVEGGNVQEGIWSCARGYYTISAGKVTFSDFITGDEEIFSVVSDNEKLILKDSSGRNTADIKLYNDNSVRFVWSDDTTDKLRYLTSADGFRFYSGNNIEKAVQEHLERTYNIEMVRSAVNADASGTVSVKIWVNDIQGQEQYVGEYRIDNRTGNGTDVTNNIVCLFAEPFRGFHKGVWLFGNDTSRSYMVINSDDKTGTLYTIYDGSSDKLEYTYDDTSVTLKTSAIDVKCQITPAPGDNEIYYINMLGNNITAKFLYDTEPEKFSFFSDIQLAQMLGDYVKAVSGTDAEIAGYAAYADDKAAFTLSNGDVYIIDHLTAKGTDPNGKEIDLQNIPSNETEGCITDEELINMAERNLFFKKLRIAADSDVKHGNDGSAVITMTDPDGEIIDVYTVDPKTGKGTDSSGNEIDLPQTGNNSPADAAAAGSAGLLTVIGAFVILRSGVLRRRRNKN